MSVAGWLQYVQDFFGGEWSTPDRAQVDKRGALKASNVRFFGKQVSTRYGFKTAISLAASASGGMSGGMFNWLSEIGNYLFWLNVNTGPGIYATDVRANPPVEIAVTSSASALGTPSWAAAGPRLYVAQWGISSNRELAPSGAPAVITANSATSFNYDRIIPGPASTAATGSGVQIPLTAPTEPGGGVVTAGLHNIGFRMLHRSGFLGRPGPDSSTSSNPTTTTFAPIVFTSAGGKNLNWTFTPVGTWPADVVQVQVLMSPVSNPNRIFLVPGAVQAVTGGASTPVNVTINIDDDSLIAGAAQLECTNSLNFYTASATGQAFLVASDVKIIGNRAFYVTYLPDPLGNNVSTLLISDIENYQQVSLSQHFMTLPNGLKITTVAGIQGAIYIFGPHWTYSTRDTGGVPVTWPIPSIVDGRKGAVTPLCVEVATSGRYAWIADSTGVFYFDGSYPLLPISHQQSALWTQLTGNPINPFLHIKDNPLARVLVVGLGSSPPKMMVWDYMNGADAYSARYSNWQISDVQMSGAFIEIVQNDLFGANSRHPELWLGQAASTGGTLYIARMKQPVFDTNVYRDEVVSTTPIHMTYEPNIFPTQGFSVGEADVLAHQASMIRIVGGGNITPQVFSFDKTQNIILPTINLTALTEGKAFAGGYLISQGGFIYHFDQNVLDGFMTLTDITMYYTHYASHP